MGKRWRGYGFALTGIFIVVWVALVAALLLTFHPPASDWSTYYDTARAFRTSPRADLWDYATTVWGSEQPGGCPLWPALPYKYPPLLAILVAPLTLAPCPVATFMWRLLMLAMWGASAIMLAAPDWRAGKRGWALGAVALIACYPPLIDGMLLGQVHLIILVSVLAGVALVAQGRQAAGGVALALGVWIKYVPGVVAAYYLLTGRWRVAAGAAVAGAALLLAQVALVGPASMVESLNPTMFTTTGAVWDGWPGGSLWGIATGAVFVVGAIATRWGGGGKADDALGVGWALCTMLLASPVIQWLYLTWLLPAFWACLIATWRIARRARNPRDWRRWAPLAALVVIFGISLVPFNHIANSVTIISLWLLCGALYVRSAGIQLPRRSIADMPDEGVNIARIARVSGR